MPMSVLNVAEKPTVAREISSILSQGSDVIRRPGRSRYNPIVEFTMSLPNAPNSRMIFTSVLGHLWATDFAERWRPWTSCDPQDLFSTTRTDIVSFVPEKLLDVRSTLHEESRRCSWIILWLDCDSEGEKIADEVRQECLKAQPSLRVFRARFSAITRNDLMRAIGNLGSLDQRQVAMVNVRQELDLRAGAAFTRFQTKKLKDRYNLGPTREGQNQVISYGPCQIPTLGLVVDRYLAIRRFQSRNFYVIDLVTTGVVVNNRNVIDQTTGVLNFSWNRQRIFDRFYASILYERATECAVANSNRAEIIRVDKNQRRKWKPYPLSTVELQKEAASKLRLSSEQTMDLAEKMYTQGYISYPRTETDRFNSNIDLRALVNLQTGDRNWGNFATRLLNNSPTDPSGICFETPRQGRNDDQAHPPIHPTKPMPPEGFGEPGMARLYEYITRRFLASCSVDAIGSETKILAAVGDETFLSTGLIIERKGYLEIFEQYGRWSQHEVPPLRPRDWVPIESLILRESVTQPPSLLSESDLISLMDRHGIGTDATISEHIKKILHRGYAIKNETNRFAPLDLGLALIESYQKCGTSLAHPTFRAQQETDLKRIAAGSIAPEQVLLSSLESFIQQYNQLQQNFQHIDATFQTYFNVAQEEPWTDDGGPISKCGECQIPMRLKKRSGHNNRIERALSCQTCNKILRLPISGELQADHQQCRLCNFQALKVSAVSDGRTSTYYICPFCFNNPPSDITNEVNFKCFQCTASDCSLATAVQNGNEVGKCLKCNQICSIAKKPDAQMRMRFRYSCTSRTCDFVYFFPSALSSLEVLDNPCAQCGTRTLQILWSRGMIPMGANANFSGCIFCDENYHRFLREIDAQAVPTPTTVRNASVNFGRGASSILGRDRGRGQARTRGRTRGTPSGVLRRNSNSVYRNNA